MNASYFKHLISADHYSPADLEQVNDLCRNYPMFNLAHMLKVRVRESLAYDKEQELKLAAIYAADRRKLFSLVTSVSGPVVEKEETGSKEEDGIVFSSEPHPEVDVIIEQHVPYAGNQPEENDLLELEEEPEEEPEISSEALIESVAKEEAEMEEPETRIGETPAIDKVEPAADDEVEPAADNKVEPATDDELPVTNRLIQSFLKEDPGPIRADKYRASNKDASIASVQEHDGFITDTLAKIYVKQGLYAKAIYAYEKLSLKYPEKSAYFAAQIEKISNINHS